VSARKTGKCSLIRSKPVTNVNREPESKWNHTGKWRILIMKKLLMFVMVLMLCIGPAARAAEPVAFYSLTGCLEDNTGNGNDGTIAGTEIYSGEVPDQGSGGESLSLDGASSVITTLDTCIFEDDFTITFWFKTETALGCAIGIGDPNQDIDEHGITIYINDDGGITNDVWMRAANGTSGGWDDGQWHHYALVQEHPSTQTLYIDGVVDETGDASYADYDCSYSGSAFAIGTHLDVTDGGVMDDLGVNPFTGLIKDVGVYDEALNLAGVEEAMDEGDYQCPWPRHPLWIDPNESMLVHETNTTESAFKVSLNFQPVGQGGTGSPQGTPYTVIVTIDPNGGNGGWGELPQAAGERDIVLLDGTDPCTTDNTMTLNFTAVTATDPCDLVGSCSSWDPATKTSCWNTPQTILFKALEDLIAEKHPEPPSTLIEEVGIGITITSNVAEPNLNQDLEGNPWFKSQTVEVRDNDQADILFSGTPVWLKEEPLYIGFFGGDPCYKKVTVGVTLQLEPRNDENPGSQGYVQIIVTNESDSGNQPIMDPCLVPGHAHTPSDPNAIVFTSDGSPAPGVIGATRQWDVPYNIVLKANEDEELQAEETSEEGDQYYNANLVFLVQATSDERYMPLDEENEPDGMEKEVGVKIEDNECGAFGISYLDIGNPNAATDPNYQDEDGNPLADCYVDTYDVIEMATRWLDCSDPQTAGCIHYND
jgi:hypothetical protein